jgi:hypothetical protein
MGGVTESRRPEGLVGCFDVRRRLSPYLLWIGNVAEARDLQAVEAAGNAVIVDLAANESPIAVTRELSYCRFPLVDDPKTNVG